MNSRPCWMSERRGIGGCMGAGWFLIGRTGIPRPRTAPARLTKYCVSFTHALITLAGPPQFRFATTASPSSVPCNRLANRTNLIAPLPPSLPPSVTTLAWLQLRTHLYSLALNSAAQTAAFLPPLSVSLRCDGLATVAFHADSAGIST